MKPVSTAFAAQTPAKQSACSSTRTARLSAPWSCAAVEGAEQVLHVMPVLVGDDVGLRERAALGAEAQRSSSKNPRSM